ncbi:MAG: NAD(P)-dependent alcohol dehydrogenase [Acidimicrobiales bacterium]
MKAVVCRGYGPPADVLELADVAPPQVGDDEVLVRVRAASVHPDVWHVVTGRPHMLRLMGAGVRRPKNPIPGTDMAGVVEVVGSKVTHFAPGDEVYGETVQGHQWHHGGAYAELVAVPAEALAHKPAVISFEQAAAVPSSGYIALQGVHDEGEVTAGQRVLVNGAGGGVGTFAVQLAKWYGAEVTGVDTGDKLDTVRAVGADHVIDYTTNDFTDEGQRYDVIVDIPGNRSWSDYRRALTPEGRYVLIGHDQFGEGANRWIGSLSGFLKLVVLAPFNKQLKVRVAAKTDDPLAVLTEIIEAQGLTPIVDRTFPLAQAAEAMDYMTRGRARGKIILTP